MSRSAETWVGVDPTAQEAPPALSAPGHDLAGLIGIGGMGEVWRVHDQLLDRTVALKVIRAGLAIDVHAVGLFAAEARATAGLEHPGIAPVYAAGRLEDGRPFYTMKVLRGQTLHALAAAQAGALDEAWIERAVTYVIEACRPVAFAHEQGLLHCDLKPENILIGPHGEVTVLDWGLVRAWPGGPAAARGVPVGVGSGGTRGFMPPEQARGAAVTPAADTHALAATLRNVLGDPAHLPPTLASVLERALSPDPADRQPDAAAFSHDLEAWRDGARREARRDDAVRRAEALWGELDGPARSRARALLLRLVDGDRRPVRISEALAGELAGEPTLRHLASAGLVVHEAETLRLADPTLVETWPRLSSWLDAEGPRLAIRARLAAATDAWRAGSVGGWGAADVQRAEGLSDDTLGPHERAFLAVSRAGVRTRRRRQLLLLGGLAVISTVAAGTLAALWREAELARTEAEGARREAEAHDALVRGEQAEFHHRPHEALALYRAADALRPGLGTDAVDRIVSAGVSSWVVATHPGGAWTVEWSDDGRLLYTGGADGWIHVVRAADGAEERRLGPLQYDVIDVVVAPAVVSAWGYFDALVSWTTAGSPLGQLGAGRRARAGMVALPGARVVTGGRDGLVRLWEPETGREVARWGAPAGTRPYGLAVRDDGAEVAVATLGGDLAQLRASDLTPTAVGALGAKPIGIGFVGSDAVAIAADGNWRRIGAAPAAGRVAADEPLSAFATRADSVAWSVGKTLVLAAPTTLQPLRTLTGQRGVIDRINWDAAGALLASSSQDEAVVWSLRSGIPVTLDGHDAPVRRTRFQPGGSLWATAGQDGTARIWGVRAMERDVELRSGGVGVTELASSGETVLVRTADGRCGFLDGATEPCAELAAVAGRFGAWTGPDGGLVLAHADGGRTRLAPFGDALGADICPTDGRILLVGRRGSAFAAAPGEGDWRRFPIEQDPFYTWPDACAGRVGLVSALGQDGAWDLESGERLRSLPHDVRLNFLPAQAAYTRARGTVAFAGHAGGVHELALWGGDDHQLATDDARIGALVYSADGSLLAATGFDRLVRVWRVADGVSLWKAGPFEGVLDGLVFSADGRHLAVDGDGGLVRTWDVATGRMLRTVRSPRSTGRSMAFLPDGRLALPGADGRWRAWEIPEVPPEAASLTNLRVCRASGRVVPVLPFPTDDGPWAPVAACPG